MQAHIRAPLDRSFAPCGSFLSRSAFFPSVRTTRAGMQRATLWTEGNRGDGTNVSGCQRG